MTWSEKSPTQAANRGYHGLWNPSAQSPYEPGQVMSWLQGQDSAVQTTECHTSSLILVHIGEQEISPTRIQACLWGVLWIFFLILPNARHSDQASWLSETFVKLVLSEAQVTGTIITPVERWSCVSHHQSPEFNSWYIPQLSESPTCTGSNSRCAWNGRYVERNCIYFTIAR